MTLYINRWGEPNDPLHVFNLDTEYIEVVGENPNHTAVVQADFRARTALCGVSVEQANNDEDIAAAEPNDLLRLSKLDKWDGLEDFAHTERLCETCRRRLAVEWPPARELLDIEPDTTSAVIVSESPNEVIVDNGDTKYTLDPEDVPDSAGLGSELEWYDSDLTPLEDAA